MSQLPSPQRNHIMSVISNSGSAGATTGAIAEATGLQALAVRVHVKNLQVKGLIFGGKKPGTPGQVYLLPEHLLAYQSAHGIAPAGARAANMPARATSVMVVKTGKQRNNTVSPARLAVEALMEKTEKALTPLEISKATGLDMPHTNRILQQLRIDGHSVNIGAGKAPLWRAAGTEPPKRPREPRVCNASMPTMRYSLSPQPARADALQHLEIKSRRGDQLVPAMPPMLIGSGIGGGMR